MRRAPLPSLCALLAGAAAALAVGCGDRSHLISASDASSLKGQLAAVQSAVDAGDCITAQAALNRASATAQQALAAPVDRRLRRRVLQGIQKLRETVPVDCQQAQTTTTPTVTETTPTETVPTETTPTETVPTTTTPTTTTPTTPTETTPTTPTPTTPEQTTPGGTPPDTGGTPDQGATP